MGVLILLFFSLAYATHRVHLQLIAEPEWSKLEDNVLREANSIAADVNQFIAIRQRQQADIINTFQPQQLLHLNPDKLQLVAEHLNSALSESEFSYIITQADPIPNTNSNFVALDIGRQLLTGDNVEPQASKVDGQWHVLIASTFSDTDTAIPQGAIISGFSLNALAQKFQLESGNVKLIQRVNGSRSVTLIATNQASTVPNKVTASPQVSHWKIEFSPSIQLLEHYRASSFELALYYTCLVSSAFLFLWIALRLSLIWRRNHLSKQALAAENRAAEQAIINSATSFISGIPLQDSGAKQAQATQSENQTMPSSTDDVFEMREKIPQQNHRHIPAHIFRAYDIRGVYGSDINNAFARELGLAFGTLAQRNNQSTVVTARDGRSSSPQLYRELLDGIEASGCNIIEIGQCHTPLLNFALQQLVAQTMSGISVTASHNPAEYNGFKMFLNGSSLTAEQVQNLHACMIKQDYLSGHGQRCQQQFVEQYIQQVANDIAPASNLHVVVDAANGACGPIVLDFFEAIGCKVSLLYCDVEGDFPNHDPDPSVVANLQDLRQVVVSQGADLGIALDGDGDRVVAITASGAIVWPDEMMMIFARDILAKQSGANIVFDVKCTNRLASVITSYGGNATVWKTGHSNMRSKIQELKAPLGGEYSGHIFFSDRWYGFDDGMYCAARLIEIITSREQSLDDILATLPKGFASDEYKIAVPDAEKFALVAKLITNADFKEAKLTTLDGLRVEFASGWGLVRASNTTPALTLRFEGNTQQDLKHITELFKQQLTAIDPTLIFDF